MGHPELDLTHTSTDSDVLIRICRSGPEVVNKALEASVSK